MEKLSFPSDPTTLTAEWLNTALATNDHSPDRRVASLRHELVGTGQMGRNFRLHLTWEDGEGPATVVAKFPSDDPKSRATGGAQGAYRKEICFYKQVAPTVDIRLPECLFADIADNDTDFILLMEDLAPATQGDQIAAGSVAQAERVVDEAAALHAPRWGDSSLSDLDFLTQPSADGSKLLAGLYQVFLPEFTSRYSEKLGPDCMGVVVRLGQGLESWSLGSTAPRTVTHGDFRLDNMMFPADEKARVAVVDWQTVGVGAGTADLAYYIGGGLLAEERRKHEEDLVRRYWHALAARGVVGYGWDQCWNDYRRSTYSGVIMAVIASILVEQTERGDEMFIAMCVRAARQALDLDSEEFLNSA